MPLSFFGPDFFKLRVPKFAISSLVISILLSHSAFAQLSCGPLFVNAEASLYHYDAQVALRKDFGDLNHIDDLGYSYSTAKDREQYVHLAESFRSRLSKEELAELKNYTALSGSYHERLNQSFAKGSQKDSLVSIYKSMFSKGVTLPSGFILFRGIGPGAQLTIPSQGKFITWKRLTSTSMDPETARYFTNGGKATMLVIETAEPIQSILATSPKEMEFILPPNTQFEVLKKKYFSAEGVSVVWVRAFSPKN